jgi:DNA mismatch endonuclease, patch repair protein
MDTISTLRRSENMRAIRSRGTAIEVEVEKIIRRLHVAYRRHLERLPGKPDFAFPEMKKAIFVHGCFWHQHTSKRCGISRMPKSHLDYWEEKLRKNARRDRANRSRLARLGWVSMVIWECQVRRPTGMRRILRFVQEVQAKRRPEPTS